MGLGKTSTSRKRLWCLWGDFASQKLNFLMSISLELQSHKQSYHSIPLVFTSMWPCNKYPLCHLTLNFVLCFSTELDVEDFDAFLEKVKARSLGNSPFACKFRLALKKGTFENCILHGSYNITQTNCKDFWRTTLQFSRAKIYSINCHSLTPSWTPYWD